MRLPLAFVLLGAACAPLMSIPTVMHPTVSPAEKSVGVAVGGAYVNPEGTDTSELVSVPYAEGWIRFPVAENAQLGIHAGSGVGHLALRYDVMPVGGGVGIAIHPVVGGGYGKSSAAMDEDSQNVITLSGGLGVLFLIPAGTGHAWVAPAFGYGWTKLYDDSDMSDEEGNKLYTVGLSAGIDVGDGLSVELTVHRIDDAEDQSAPEPDPDPVWMVVPTIGVRH